MIVSSEKNVEKYGIDYERRFLLSDSPFIFEILSNNLYSNKIQSIVRELSSNARDAHISAGKENIPFEITITDKSKIFADLSTKFSIRDFGTGMSEEEIYNLYSVYGESNKRDSNEYIGGFGIGSKSPFSYTDSFNIISVYNGTKSTYVAYINENGYPSISKVSSFETHESNSFEVSFLIKDEDVNSFHRAIRSQLRFFDPLPVVNGEQISFKNNVPYNKYNDWFLLETEDDYKIEPFSAYFIIGGVPYKIDREYMRTCNTLGYYGLFIKLNVGDVDISASREALSYTEKTISCIEEKIQKVSHDVLNDFMSYRATHSKYDSTCYVCESGFHSILLRNGFADLDIYNTVSSQYDEINELIKNKKPIKIWKAGKLLHSSVNMSTDFCFRHDIKRFLIQFSEDYSWKDIKSYLEKNGYRSKAYVIRSNDKSLSCKILEMLGSRKTDDNFLYVPYSGGNGESVPSSKNESVCVYVFSDSPYCSYDMFSKANLIKKYINLSDIEKFLGEKILIVKSKNSIYKETGWTEKQEENINRLLSRCKSVFRYVNDNAVIMYSSEYKRIGAKLNKELHAFSYHDFLKHLESHFLPDDETRDKAICMHSHSPCNPEVERIVDMLCDIFTKEEVSRYSEKSKIFDLASTRLHIDSKSIISILRLLYENSTEENTKSFFHEYEDYIEKNPILKLVIHTGYYSDTKITKECLIRYLKLEG